MDNPGSAPLRALSSITDGRHPSGQASSRASVWLVFGCLAACTPQSESDPVVATTTGSWGTSTTHTDGTPGVGRRMDDSSASPTTSFGTMSPSRDDGTSSIGSTSIDASGPASTGDVGDLENPVEAFMEGLKAAMEAGVLVVNHRHREGELELAFEDGVVLRIPSEFVTSIDADPQRWSIELLFVDGQALALGLRGDDLPFDASDVTMNPFGAAPLVGHLPITTPVPGRFSGRVLGQDGEASDFLFSSDTTQTDHELWIYGLYPDYHNTVEVTFTDAEGRARLRKSLIVRTEPIEALDQWGPQLVVEVPYDDPPPPNTVFMINTYPLFMPLFVDAFGKVRYVFGTDRTSKRGLMVLRNGNFGFGSGPLRQIFEYAWTGEQLDVWETPAAYGSIHHDAYEASNGNFLATVHAPEADTNQDVIVEIDRDTHEIVNVWDLRDSLQMDRLEAGLVDWVHVNAVVDDPSDDTIIVSSRHHGIIKLTRDNEVRWILGPSGGWNEQFKPLVMELGVGTDAPAGQHSSSLTASGTLIAFDNGSKEANRIASRVVEFALEEFPEGGGQATQRFEFGREPSDRFSPDDLFSPIMGDVDLLDASQTFVVTAGSLSYEVFPEVFPDAPGWNNEDPEKFRVFEVDRHGNVLFQMLGRYAGTEVPGSAYRAEKMTLPPIP